MATRIETSIHIQATPELVWEILTDFHRFGQWNPFIPSLEGDVKPGKRIRVRLTPPGQKDITMQPRVLIVEAGKKFEWLGHLLFPGIFDGAHRFELLENPDGSTTFIQSEEFHGILVPFLQKMLNGPTLEGFRQMNAALKERAELH